MYSTEEVIAAWDNVCISMNQRMKSEYESLMKAKEKYQIEAQKFVAVDGSHIREAKKWAALLPYTLRTKICNNSLGTLNGLDDYDYSSINSIEIE